MTTGAGDPSLTAADPNGHLRDQIVFYIIRVFFNERHQTGISLYA